MNCVHRQAEPVTLSTGEHVACICTTCFDGLPAEWIQRQYDAAHREAYCEHRDEVSIRQFGEPHDTLICTSCGRMRRD